MGYVVHGFPSQSSGQIKYAYTDDFSGGVKYSEVYKENERCSMVNLFAKGTALKTRPYAKKIFEWVSNLGKVHSYTKNPFCENTLIHAGSNLFAVNSDEQDGIRAICSGLPDEHSIMVKFKSKIYIYSNYRVFSVDKDMNVTEEEPYAPLAFSGLLSGGSPTPDNFRTSASLNIVAPIIRVNYIHSSNTKSLAFPVAADLSRPVKVYIKGEELDSSSFTVTTSKVSLQKSMDFDAGEIEIKYYVDDISQINFKDFMKEAKVCTSFGGTDITGTRLVVSGNQKYPGQFYTSILLNPLRIDETSYETIGNASENVTGFIKQYGRLIVFTDASVCCMTYDYGGSNSVFSVKELNNTIGCDMPGSIELIDNRIVFGNSRKGLFIVDATEDFGEQNIKPLFANISSHEKYGLLKQDRQSLKDAKAVDFDTKYILCVGDKMYIWDYGITPFYDNGNYITTQKRLCWYVYDSITADAVFECNSKLFIYKDTDQASFFVFDENVENPDIDTFYESPAFEMSAPANAKIPEDITLDITGDEKTVMTLCAIADKKEYYRISFAANMYTHQGGRGVVIKLPKKRMKVFSFRLESKSGRYSLSRVAVKYRVDTKIL